MDKILQSISGIVVYLDDILLTGPTFRDHLESLETVLDRLMKAGPHIKKANVHSCPHQSHTWDTK